MAAASLRERRDRALGPGAPLFYDTPLQIVRGDGVHVFDEEGRGYVDMYNNVPCVGHGNPRVAEAVARAQATLNVHSRYLHEGIVVLAERLAALHGPQIESLVFTCSGTEANEVAIRMARLATGRRGVVCSDAAYHGNSELVSALTHVGRRSPETDEIKAFSFPDTYRAGVEPGADARVADASLDRLAAAIQGLKASGAGLAAMIVCSIFANEGLPDIPAGFMARAAEMVRAAGGLVIADEVQAGYCRTGRWWGYEATGFSPDIVVTGKPMGGGVPLAAAAASQALVATFRAMTRYFNAFASSPLQAAAGAAVLDEIEARDLRASVAAVSEQLKQALARRAAPSAAIGDVRGHGLFIGLEMVEDPTTRAPAPRLAAKVCNLLKDRGYLTGAGAFGNVVKIRPPLVFSERDAEGFLRAFDETIDALDG